MIFPVSHERETLLRWPVVTLGLIVICLAAQLLLSSSRDEMALYEDAIGYWLEHAYLSPGDGLRADRLFDDPEIEVFVETWAAAEEPPPDQLDREQAELDGRVEAWRRARDSAPMRRWGLTPARLEAGDFLTYMFLHAGWLHLLGNLFILYLAGAPLEDVWGRPLYLVFYLVSGVAAALLFALRYSDSGVPLVGASGAIAGLMGAFLVRFWRVKIKFVYFVWIFLRIWSGTFSASAWLILPLWFANEAFWAYVSDHFYRVAPGEGAAGVAYLAHLGGFLFGAFFATGVKALGLEEKHLRPRIHDSIGLVENPALEEAGLASSQGNPERARELLEQALREDPGNRDLVLALWDVAIRERQAARVAPRLIRVLHAELQEGESEIGLQHWEELQTWAPDAPVPAKVGVQVAEMFLELERREEAERVVRRFAPAAAELPQPYVPRFVRAAVSVDPKLASEVARHALAMPELPAETRSSLRQIAAAFPEEETPSSEGRRPDQADAGGPARVHRKAAGGPAEDPREGDVPEVEVVAAIPLKVTETAIVLRVGRHDALPVPYRRLRAVGAAEIRVSDDRPYWILDLVLPPRREGGAAVVLRCESRYFELLDLIPGESDPGRALIAVLGRLLGGSGVALIPEDFHPFRPQPLASFPSAAEYQRALCESLALSVDPAGSSGPGPA